MPKIKSLNDMLQIGSLLCLSIFITSCLLGPQSKRGTVVDNEIRVGTILLAGGGPAVNARVRVIPVGHVPTALADTGKEISAGIYATRTDSSGKFTVEALPEGEYNILADLSGQYAFQDSVYLNTKTKAITADTLDAPGSMIGIVALEPNHDPRSILVQVLGTNAYANVDAQGNFRLSALGEGRYTLRVITTLPDYASLFHSLTIGSGKKDTLHDTLRLQYFGIPVVQGLKAVYDTAKSIVTLKWNSAVYRDFSEYLIYRDESPALTLSQAPIGLSIDTVFQDSLLKSSAFFFLESGDISKNIEYRVRIKNKSDQLGLSYGHVTIAVTPRSKVITTFEFKVDRIVWDSVRQADSVIVTVKAANPSRNLQGFSWGVGTQLDMLKEILPGNDKVLQRTLKFGWSQVGAYKLFVSIADASGGLKIDSLLLHGNTPPRISPILDTSIQVLVPFSFRPVMEDLDGDSLKFTIKNLPKWATFDSNTGTLSGTPGNLDLGEHTSIVYSVFDGRRTVASNSFKIVVLANPWTVGAKTSILSSSSYAVSLAGKIFLFSHSIVSVFDTTTKSWTSRDSIGTGEYVTHAAIIEGKIIVFTKTYQVNSYSYAAMLYNPSTKTYTKLKDFPGNFEIYSGAVVGGVFYSIGNGQVWSYNLAANSWSVKKAMPSKFGISSDSNNLIKCATGNGKVLVIGVPDSLTQNSMPNPAGHAALYDPATDAWVDVPTILPRYSSALTVVGSKAYLMGGVDGGSGSNRVEVFDFVSKTWSEKLPMPQATSSMAFAASGTKIYLFQGLGKDWVHTDATWIYDTTINP